MNELCFRKNLHTHCVSHIGCAKLSRAIPNSNSYMETDPQIPSHLANQDEEPLRSPLSFGNKPLGFASSKLQQAIKWRDLDIIFGTADSYHRKNWE